VVDSRALRAFNPRIGPDLPYVDIKVTKPPTMPLPREEAARIGRELLALCGEDLEVLIGRLGFALADHDILDHRRGWDR
jgi:hypothetical protein